MSIKIRKRLRLLNIPTIHKERVLIDQKIEDQTNKICEKGIADLNDEEFCQIVKKAKEEIAQKDKKKKIIEIEV